MPIRDWSQTAASNTTLEGINVAEGSMNVSDFNNVLRALAAAIREVQANATIASAATVNIGAANAEHLQVSGTTTITAFDNVAAGVFRVLHFSGVLTLTHNATTLILPTGANIVTAAGDVAMFRSLGSGNWRCTGYMRGNGTALVTSGGTVTSVAAGSGLSVVGGGPITTTGTLALDINGLTEETAIDGAADFLAFYDTSASGLRKVKPNEIPGLTVYGNAYTRDPIGGVDWDSGNVAHGLGVVPASYHAYLECKITELNYSVGDRVSLNVAQYTAGTTMSLAVVGDATNFRVRYGNNGLPSLPNKTATGGGSTTITGANWKLVVTPFRVTT